MNLWKCESVFFVGLNFQSLYLKLNLQVLVNWEMEIARTMALAMADSTDSDEE